MARASIVSNFNPDKHITNLVLNKDWMVGPELHKTLSKATLDDLMVKRKEASTSGEISGQKISKPQFTQISTIVQPPQANMTQQANMVDIEEINTESIQPSSKDPSYTYTMFLASLDNSNNPIHCIFECRVHLDHYCLLFQYAIPLGVLDGEEDSMVVSGASWLNITLLSGPLVRYANVKGFAGDKTRLNNLPICMAITFAKCEDNTRIIIRVLNGIWNEHANHTLLSTHWMRDMGILVDDVHKTHPKDRDGNMGAQCIKFLGHDNAIIPVQAKQGLMVFELEKPTYKDYTSGCYRIFDIQSPTWDPKEPTKPPLGPSSYSKGQFILYNVLKRLRLVAKSRFGENGRLHKHSCHNFM